MMTGILRLERSISRGELSDLGTPEPLIVV
jgi:hypothetical protein